MFAVFQFFTAFKQLPLFQGSTRVTLSRPPSTCLLLFANVFLDSIDDWAQGIVKRDARSQPLLALPSPSHPATSGTLKTSSLASSIKMLFLPWLLRVPTIYRTLSTLPPPHIRSYSSRPLLVVLFPGLWSSLSPPLIPQRSSTDGKLRKKK